MEQGKFEPTEEGSAQGSVMSPMLANIYMHHVLTLWFKLVVQREMQGECFLVNFADDFVAGFQYKSAHYACIYLQASDSLLSLVPNLPLLARIFLAPLFLL